MKLCGALPLAARVGCYLLVTIIALVMAAASQVGVQLPWSRPDSESADRLSFLANRPRGGGELLRHAYSALILFVEFLINVLG